MYIAIFEGCPLMQLFQIDESSKQREEINRLLSQVCDLQKRLQNYSHENDDLTSNLRVYQVTFEGRVKDVTF